MKNLLLIVPLILLICSCDPGVHFERVIENKSSHDVWVKVNQDVYPAFLQDSFLVAKNSSIIVSSGSSLGRVDEFSYCGLEEGTLSSGVFTSDTLEIQKNLNEDGNWSPIVKSKAVTGGGECECRFTITNNDIH